MGFRTRRGRAAREFEISYTLPSACARALEAGTADIGIIPAAAYAQVPGLMVLPGVAIASRRPVRSILLVSRLPIEKIRTVALDTSSMTSVALTKILFEKWLGGGRTFTSMEPDVEKMLAQHDAGLLIGDPALQIDRSRYLTLDLAEEWIRHTGKPFVFAFWAVRARMRCVGESEPPSAVCVAKRRHAQDLATIFQHSRDHGLEPASLDQITREWAPRLGLKEADVRSYLTENIYYHLDAACLEGLQLFYRYAAEIGALPAAPEIHFLIPGCRIDTAQRNPVPACKLFNPNAASLNPLLAVPLWRKLRHLGGIGLILLGLVDNSVIPLTGSMDVLTIWLAARHREPWPYYALMATLGAVIGGYITYGLARKGGKETMERKLSKKRAAQVSQSFARWGFAADRDSCACCLRRFRFSRF